MTSLGPPAVTSTTRELSPLWGRNSCAVLCLYCKNPKTTVEFGRLTIFEAYSIFGPGARLEVCGIEVKAPHAVIRDPVPCACCPVYSKAPNGALAVLKKQHGCLTGHFSFMLAHHLKKIVSPAEYREALRRGFHVCSTELWTQIYRSMS